MDSSDISVLMDNAANAADQSEKSSRFNGAGDANASPVDILEHGRS
jgi:hypothetical protein